MSSIEVISISDFLQKDFPEASPVVEGIIHREEMILLTAPAKAGKSALSLDLVLSVAQGVKFLQKYETHKTNILLIQTEISNSHFQKRIKQHGFDSSSENAEIYLSNTRIRLDSKDDLEKLKELLIEKKCGLLILDPFYTLHNKDENSAMEIAPILTGLQQVIRETHIACILIHHQGKGIEGTGKQVGHKARGTSAFADVPDGSMSLHRRGDKTLSLSFEFRNRESGSPIELVACDGLNFKYASTNTNAEPDKGILIQEKIKNCPKGVLMKEIILLFHETLKLSQSTAEKEVKKAVERNLIIRHKVGREFYYFHPDFIATHLPVIAPSALKGCDNYELQNNGKF